MVSTLLDGRRKVHNKYIEQCQNFVFEFEFELDDYVT